MFAFLALLFILLVIYFYTSTRLVQPFVVKEGFNPMNRSSPHMVNIPVDKIPVQAQSIPDNGPTKPYTEPGQLPVAPYQQIAVMSSLPYQDTALIKANRQQLVSLLEMLKGFLAFEAQEISERSDPTIQLPLNNARSDFHVLQSAVEVLNRNPGLQPTMTLSHLNDIASNLAFLQQTVRLSGAAGQIQGPIYEFTQPVRQSNEGFQNQKSKNMDTVNNGVTTADDSTQPSHDPVSLDDLLDFSSKIQCEIERLSSSATTDPVVTARVASLTKMKNDVDNIATQVRTGNLLTTDVPIMKSTIKNALPLLSKPSEPLPQIIKELRLPPGMANLLPSNLQKDPDTTRQISKLLDKYVNKIVDGVSATFSIDYKPPSEREARRSSTIDIIGFPSTADLANVTNDNMSGGTRAENFLSITDPTAAFPQDAGRGPAHFDWRQRAKEIEGQVKARGLNPEDYGIIKKNGGEKKSRDFSWKGYARMICTRLQATMDPGLPETCGCPPMDWNGWRN
jgi:SepF-like predicted cell division protein (DUF552 family)